MRPTIDSTFHDGMDAAISTPRRLIIGFLLLLALVISLGGCMASSSREDSQDTPYRLQSAADMDRLAVDLAAKRVIYVGETHDRMDHHQLQLAVLDALQRAGRDLAIGVEWFQHRFQPVVDDFIAGRIDEAELLQRTEYFERWRFDYRLYRPIIQYAQSHRIPVIALNAPRELTDAVSKHGLDAVPRKIRRQLPDEYDRSNTEYEDFLRQVFKQHGVPADDERIERFIQVQLTWDETMAERVSDYLADHPDKTMVVFAGSGHIAYGAGIPDRVQRRGQLPASIVLPGDVAVSMPGSADILVATEPVTLPKSGLMGIFLETTVDGLAVEDLAEGESGARDAGLQKGDLLLSVDGRPIPHLAALKLALIDKTPGSQVNLSYRRTTPGGIKVDATAWVTLH